MAHRNINMAGVGMYHPSRIVGNEYYIEHFRKQGIEISGLLERLGRENRYQADPDTDGIEMGIKASEAALKNAGITTDQLDMIVFVSETPEFTSPTNALKLHHFLQATNAHVTYDMNGCCTGMITAIDQVSRNMRTNPSIRYALLAGVILITPQAHEKDPMFYATFGDASAAVILENVVEESPRGFIDSQYITDSSVHYSVQIPMCGFSKLHRDDVDPIMKMAGNVPFDFSFLPDQWSKTIHLLLDKQNLKTDEIDHFIFSQFSKEAILQISEKLSLEGRFTFVGDQYGYTGCTSPIIALHHAINDKKLQAGSKVILISVGSGYNISAVLYQF